ncbi:MAG: GNAT family N-acetyltransferase [Muribaculaceae bacterium]|nr:GNAT family N-acetyltransferase [Muribaculaceae bacterium]
MDYDIKRMEPTEQAVKEVMRLLHLTFPNRVEKFSFDYLKWQYLLNPRGNVLAFNAYATDGQLAAHYAVIPVEMLINGQRTEGMLSLNTATHPDHRGKRLFTILAQQTYDTAKEMGRKFVIGVANANSTHGFLKNLGFYLISPLDVRVGVCDPYIHEVSREKNRIYYDEPTIQWRLQCPYFSYSVKGNTILGKMDKPLFHTAVAKLPQGMKADQLGLKETFSLFNLYVGLGIEMRKTYFKLPKFIKRSPFNLIFKDLTDGELPKMTKDNIFFQLLDYDVA